VKKKERHILTQGAPAQLRQLKDGLAVIEAMQQLGRAEMLAKETEQKLE
jgi:hypothetical protein